MNQRETVKQMLTDAGDRGVTSNEFFAARLPRFSARIYELRKQGHKIDTAPVERGHFLYKLQRRDVNPQGAADPPDGDSSPAPSGTLFDLPVPAYQDAA